MKIHALFILRNGEDIPELQTAWDEYCIDENFECFEKECKEKIEAIGTELESHVIVMIDVPEDKIMKRLRKPALHVTGIVQDEE